MSIWLVDILLWSLGVLPEPAARAGGRFLGFFTRKILRYRTDVVRRQLAEALPELTPQERQCLEKDFYRHLGLTLIETLRLRHLTDAQVIERSDIGGLEHYQAAVAEGRGAFILGSHAGCWEFGMAACGARGFDTCVVVKEVKSPAGQHLADSIRAAHHVVPIHRRNSIKDIFRLLKQNQCVGFVLDQNTTSDEGVFVDFFGRPACTMPGLAIMAMRTKAPVIPLVCFRDEKYRHRVRLLPPVPWQEPEAASKDEIVRHNTQRYTNVIEDSIRQHPAQWLWIHKRWRTQPPSPMPEFIDSGKS